MLVQHIKYSVFSFFIVLFCTTVSFAQQKTQPTAGGDKAVAKDNYTYGNWKEALKEYLALLAKEPENPLFNYRAGICYLYSNTEPEKAITYLDKAVKLKVGEKDAEFQLGKAYHRTYKFEKALETYKGAIANSNDKELTKTATRYIEMCNNAKELMKFPLNVDIENVGDDINSEEPDYYPYIDDSETLLLFSTRRLKGNSGFDPGDGYYTPDVFLSKEKYGKWTRSRSVGGAVCTSYDEEIVGGSHDLSIIFLRMFNMEIANDIAVSERKGNTFQKPYLYGPPINTEFREQCAFITDDKTTLYFCSDRPGGHGGYDIYVSKLLPDGEWGIPENLGPNVNTEYDDLFPYLSYDEKTLYFSSEGHSSMGGFDLFKSQWDTKATVWGKPKNMGYPINTAYDDMSICFNKTGKEAYISSWRKGKGIGDLDIYLVTFKEAEDRQTLVRGVVNVTVPIDYNEYEVWHFYENNGVVKRLPPELLPPDTINWKLKEKKSMPVKEGYKTVVLITYDYNGEEKKFSLDKAPLNDPAYVLKDVKVQSFPDKDYKPGAKKAPTTSVIVPDAALTLSYKKSGDRYGDYLPAPNSGRYVMILPPGEYTLNVDAPGYKPFTEDVIILGKGSFQDEIEKDITLTPLKPPKPIPYSKLENK
jgi:hypothetical protein